MGRAVVVSESNSNYLKAQNAGYLFPENRSPGEKDFGRQIPKASLIPPRPLAM